MSTTPTQKRKPPYYEPGQTYGYTAGGERICTGSMLGRRSFVPTDYIGQPMHLRRVPLCRNGYDPGGAYWGSPSDLWCAWGSTYFEQFEVYTRAPNRESAIMNIQRRPEFRYSPAIFKRR